MKARKKQTLAFDLFCSFDHFFIALSNGADECGKNSLLAGVG